MYIKDTALGIQFAPQRLNASAGDPYWIDLTAAEARRLLLQLQAYFAQGEAARTSVPVLTLDMPGGQPASAAAPQAAQSGTPAVSNDTFKQWICLICGWIYDEAAGLPDEGIAPGTRWQEIPDDWHCPLCDVGKSDFALVEF